MDALIVVFVTGLVAMFIAMFKRPVLVLGTSVVGLGTALVLMVNNWWNPVNFIKYEGLEFDKFAIMFSVLAMVFALLIIVGGYAYFKQEYEHTGEYISLVIFSLVGAMCMTAFTDLFMFFLGLEILSIPIYVLVGSKKRDVISSEASLKYFFTGAFATGVFLFGTAWVYGATGSFKISEISEVVSAGETKGPLLYIGILMMLASFLFKIGAAPFHFWSPDVYGGSPNIITGYMAAVVKLAGLYAFIKMFTFSFSGASELWISAIFGIAILSMFVGNLSALRQTSFKRLLAYSGIANAGYALMAILVKDVSSVYNLWIYLIGYGFSIIALMVISLFVNDEKDSLESFRGLGRRNPFVGVILVLGLLSLAGVPPLAGFFGKYMVFASAFQEYPLLVIFAIINSGIGIYYYLKVLIIAMSEGSSPEAESKFLQPTVLQYSVLTVCALGLIIGGFITL